MRLSGYGRTCADCVVWAALFTLLAVSCRADVYSPLGQPKYRCSQTGVSASNLVGKITLSSKSKNKALVGKFSWTYSALVKAIKKSSKLKTKAGKKQTKQLRAVMEVLLKCYDAKSLPRPAGSNPAATPTPTGPPGTTVNFESVRSIIDANCMTCHAARGWTLSESYFLHQGLVRAGDPAQSPLYKHLRDNPEGYLPASMPASGSALTHAQILAIHSWISGISEEPSGHFACSTQNQVAPSKMKRLSKQQFKNSIIDLTEAGLRNRETAENYAWNYSWRQTEQFADDFSALGHDRLDDRIDETYLEIVFSIIENLANNLQNNSRIPQFVQNFVPTCNQSNYLSETCRNEFLRKFGRRALKHTLSDRDYDFYRRPNTAGQSQATYNDLIIALLSSPGFLYHLEGAGTPVDASGLLVRISPTEFISRLAYTIWNTLPDEQLIQYAEDGTVDRDPALVVSYVFDQQSGKAREGIKEFFEGWLKIKHTLSEISQYFEVDGIIPQFLQVNYGTSDPPLIADTSNPETVRQLLLGYRTGFTNEVPDLGSILTFVQPAPVSELFRTRLAPVQDITLSRNYNLASPWDGNLQNIPIAPATRSGILTRTAFHVARGPRKRVIIAGRRIRQDILCDPTGLPANNSTPSGTNTGSDEFVTGSTQFQTRTITEQAGTTCAGCHQHLLNPLGFALEDFDTLGRRRNGREWVYAAPYQQPLQEFLRPYDSRVVPMVNRQDFTPVDGTAGLSERLATSDEMHACFTRNLVRFTLNRTESDDADGCFMNDIFADARNVSMKEVLRRWFLSPTYRLRRLNAAYQN